MLTYLLGIVEGSNAEIVSSLSNVFDANGLYGIMKGTMTTLFLHCHQSGNASHWLSKCCCNKRKVSPLLQTYNGRTIRDMEQLHEMYMRDLSFANNILFEVTLKIYSFMRAMAEKNTRFARFLEENDELWKEMRESGGDYTGDLEDVDDGAVIYAFIRGISASLEVMAPDIATGGDTLKTIKLIFPKRPMCLFLTQETKDQFMDGRLPKKASFNTGNGS